MKRKTNSSTTPNSTAIGTMQYKAVKGTTISRNIIDLKISKKMPMSSYKYLGYLKASPPLGFSLTFLSVPPCATLPSCGRDPSNTLLHIDNKTQCHICSWYTHNLLFSRPKQRTLDTCDNWEPSFAHLLARWLDRHQYEQEISNEYNEQRNKDCMFQYCLILRNILCNPFAYKQQHPYCFARIEIARNYQYDW